MLQINQLFRCSEARIQSNIQRRDDIEVSFSMQKPRKNYRNNSGIRLQMVLRQSHKRDESRPCPLLLLVSAWQGLLFLQYILLCMSLASLLLWLWFKAEVSNDHSTWTSFLRFCVSAWLQGVPQIWLVKESRLKCSPSVILLSYIFLPFNHEININSYIMKFYICYVILM